MEILVRTKMGIMNKPPSKEYQDGWDKIFKKKEMNKPRMLTEEEVVKLREDLKLTVEIARQTKVYSTKDVCECGATADWFNEDGHGNKIPVCEKCMSRE
jgi:hypothetical protein